MRECQTRGRGGELTGRGGAAINRTRPMEILVAIFVLAWLIFPFVLDSRLNKVLKHLAKIEKAQGDTAAAAKETLAHWQRRGAALPPIPGTGRYYLAHGEEVAGPHSRPEIEALMARGAIDNDTWILPAGEKVWRRTGDVFPKAAIL